MPAIKKQNHLLQQTFTYIATDTLFCVLQKGVRGLGGRRERGKGGVKGRGKGGWWQKDTPNK